MRVKLADFSFERVRRVKKISLVFGGTDEFLPLFGQNGGRAANQREREREVVKGGIVAAVEAKGGEGWRGKRGRCSHTKKLKGNPTAIGSALRNASSFVGIRISRSNIHMYTHTHASS